MIYRENGQFKSTYRADLQMLPILQDRGLFRREYTGRTLRDHYGLPVPQSIGRRDGALAHTG